MPDNKLPHEPADSNQNKQPEMSEAEYVDDYLNTTVQIVGDFLVHCLRDVAITSSNSPCKLPCIVDKITVSLTEETRVYGPGWLMFFMAIDIEMPSLLYPSDTFEYSVQGSSDKTKYPVSTVHFESRQYPQIHDLTFVFEPDAA